MPPTSKIATDADETTRNASFRVEQSRSKDRPSLNDALEDFGGCAYTILRVRRKRSVAMRRMRVVFRRRKMLSASTRRLLVNYNSFPKLKERDTT